MRAAGLCTRIPNLKILYDGLLRQPLPQGVSIVANADDIALIIVGKTIEDVAIPRRYGNRGSRKLAE